MISDDYKRGYSKGYVSGAKWPSFRPPIPPDPIIAELVKALIELRDMVDGVCATFDESDEVFIKLDGPINNATAALEKLGEWVKRERLDAEKARRCKVNWLSAKCQCRICGHIQVSVFPELCDAKNMECSNCHYMTSEAIEYIPAEKQETAGDNPQA